jgi:LacI family gluconate utilization system Gnt-I transcriptional repressor
VLLGYTDYDVPTWRSGCCARMLSAPPRGASWSPAVTHTPAARKLLKAAGVPVIETWDLLADPVEHTVGFSNAEAVARAGACSCMPRVTGASAFLGGVPESDARGADRRQRLCRGDARAGTGRRDARISVGHAPVSMDDGAQGMAQMLLRWPDVEAVVCVSQTTPPSAR